MADAIRVYEYFTCKILQPNGIHKLRLFQLLAAPRQVTVVSIHDTDLSQQRVAWNVVELEVWESGFRNDPNHFEAFEINVGAEVDLVAQLGADVGARRNFQIWERNIGDVEGCFQFTNARNAQPHSDVYSKAAPLLGLLDTLESMEYIMVDRLVNHTPLAGKFFDKHDQFNRAYLQCVIASEWLHSKGQHGFESRKPAAYYRLILKSPGKVAANKTAREYLKDLKLISSDDPVVPTMRARGPKRRRVDDDIEGDSNASDAPKPPPADGESSDHEDSNASWSGSSKSSKSHASSPNSSSSNSESGSNDGSDGHMIDIPENICGGRTNLEKHKGKRDVGIRLVCPHHGPACRGYRSLKLDRVLFGPWAAVYWLHAWALDGEGQDMAKHRTHKPSRASIRKVIADHYS
jgi:hypothetical protein